MGLLLWMYMNCDVFRCLVKPEGLSYMSNPETRLET